MACNTTVHEVVCVQARVTVTPDVDVGDIVTFCIDDPFIGTCDGEVRRFCEFIVSQRICVQVPLVFSALAAAVPAGIVCEPAEIGDCSGEDITCVHSAGFFRNHLDVVNDLLNGGSILLGEEIGGVLQGLSLLVDTTNAFDVLNGDAPAPPNSGPQYQQLYRQLLAAKLNVLNGATCPNGQAAIDAADEFLANSPLDGVEPEDFPPDLIQDLDDFNNGRLEGCPAHCPDDDDDGNGGNGG